MSEEYSTFIQEVDRFLKRFTRTDSIKQLIDIWLGLNLSEEAIFDKSKPMILHDIYKDHGTVRSFIPALIRQVEGGRLEFPSLSPDPEIPALPVKWKNHAIIRPFMTQTIHLLENLSQGRRSNVERIDTIREELVNVFFRLTTYSSGSIVPVRDLTSMESTIQFYSHVTNINTSDESIRINLKNDWNKAINGIFFSLHCEGVQFPAPYYPKLGALERKDELNEVMQQLEQSFDQWDRQDNKQ